MKTEQEDSGGGGTEEDVIETRTAQIWFGEDGILRIVVRSGAGQTLADAKESVAAATKATKGCKAPILIDFKRIRPMSRDARNYYAGTEAAEISLAVALVVASPVSKVVGNFFLGLNKTDCPLKLFTSEERALDWLRGFIR